MAQFVSFEGSKVESRGWTPQEKQGYSSLTRALSSHCRAIVKYTPYDSTLLERLQVVLEDAVETANGEQHLRKVVEDCPDVEHAAKSPVRPEDFVETVVRILKTKTKRLKQHSRRAKARTAKASNNVQHKVAKWPKELISEAEDFRNWNQDIFMHVAIIAMSEHFTQQGMEVKMADGIQDSYRRNDITDQIQCHRDVLGVHSYDIQASKQTAMVAKADNSWDEFYDNLDYWLQKDSQGNYTRVCAL